MKRKIIEEVKDNYINISKSFQETGDLINEYFDLFRKDIPMKEKNHITSLTEALEKPEEEEEVEKLFKRIEENEEKLLDRLSILFGILQSKNSYDKQPGANLDTKANIRELQGILETHEDYKKHKIYDMKSLREIQKLLNIYKSLAHKLNSYLIEQNRKEAQTINNLIRYANNGKLILIFDKNDELNVRALV